MMFRQSILTAVAVYLTLVYAQGNCQYYHTSCSASDYGVHECNCGGDGIVSTMTLWLSFGSHVDGFPFDYRSGDQELTRAYL